MCFGSLGGYLKARKENSLKEEIFMRLDYMQMKDEKTRLGFKLLAEL